MHFIKRIAVDCKGGMCSRVQKLAENFRFLCVDYQPSTLICGSVYVDTAFEDQYD